MGGPINLNNKNLNIYVDAFNYSKMGWLWPNYQELFRKTNKNSLISIKMARFWYACNCFPASELEWIINPIVNLNFVTQKMNKFDFEKLHSYLSRVWSISCKPRGTDDAYIIQNFCIQQFKKYTKIVFKTPQSLYLYFACFYGFCGPFINLGKGAELESHRKCLFRIPKNGSLSFGRQNIGSLGFKTHFGAGR